MPNTKLTELRPAPTRCADCPVRQKALFQVVTDDYLQEAESRRMAQYRLPARTHLFQELAPATMAFTVFEGWLLLYRTHSDGSRQGLRIALPGDFVGYVPTPDGVHTHGAMAITDVVVCGFRQADLQAMIGSYVDLARAISSIQARYLAGCESHMLGLGRKSAEQRIAHALVDLYRRLEQHGAVDAGTGAMPFPLTQEMLGELTGLTPVHTNRVLRKLRTEGLLHCTRQQVQILDLDGLSALGEYQSDDLA